MVAISTYVAKYVRKMTQMPKRRKKPSWGQPFVSEGKHYFN